MKETYYLFILQLQNSYTHSLQLHTLNAPSCSAHFWWFY